MIAESGRAEYERKGEGSEHEWKMKKGRIEIRKEIWEGWMERREGSECKVNISRKTGGIKYERKSGGKRDGIREWKEYEGKMERKMERRKDRK